MASGDQPDDDFNDVFARDSRDRGAETAAPVSDGPARDDLGRFAPKSEPAPKVEEPPKQEAAPEAPPAPTPPPTEPTPEPTANRHVPLAELLGEREKRKQEAKLREEMEARVKTYEAQVAQYQAQLQAQQQPQQPKETPPDPWTDPQAALAYQQKQFEERLAHERANMSEMVARQRFGDAAVEAAQQAAIRAGAGPYFLQQRDPYGALLQWHRQQSFLEKVGSDPDAYEKSIEQRAYEKALADLKAGKVTPGGAPQPAPAPTRFPGSLAEATPAGTQGGLLTPEAIAAELFDTNRNRRQHA